MAYITNKERKHLTDRVCASLGKQKIFAFVTLLVGLVWILFTLFTIAMTIGFVTELGIKDPKTLEIILIGAAKPVNGIDNLGDIYIGTWLVLCGGIVTLVLFIALAIVVFCTLSPREVVKDAITLSQSARSGVEGSSAGVVVEEGSNKPTQDPTLAPKAPKKPAAKKASPVKKSSKSKKK